MGWFSSFPSVNEMVSNTASNTSAVFTQFLPMLYLVIALTVGVAVLNFLTRVVIGAINIITGRRRHNVDGPYGDMTERMN